MESTLYDYGFHAFNHDFVWVDDLVMVFLEAWLSGDWWNVGYDEIWCVGMFIYDVTIFSFPPYTGNPHQIKYPWKINCKCSSQIQPVNAPIKIQLTSPQIVCITFIHPSQHLDSHSNYLIWLSYEFFLEILPFIPRKKFCTIVYVNMKSLWFLWSGQLLRFHDVNGNFIGSVASIKEPSIKENQDKNPNH